MGLTDILGPLAGAAGTALLQRTFLLETATDNGIPRILIVLDAVTSEEPTFEANVTENPVESGPEVTDHIQLRNPSLKLSGSISNTPLDLATSIGNLLAGGWSSVTSSQFRDNILNTGLQQASGIAGAKLLSGAADTKGAGLAGAADALARSILLDAYQRRARFDVVTKRQRYTSMVIQSMSFPMDAQTGRQLVFELELKQIRVVSALTVNIAIVNQDVTASASQKADLGSQATSGTTDQALKATNGSWLRSIVKGVTG